MDLTTLQTLIGDLTNDPSHERYTLDQINTELDVTQSRMNAEASILKETTTLTTVAGQSQYALTDLGGVPIAFTRVTHNGLALKKKDKAFFDLYFGGTDWTATPGTPVYYFIEATDPGVQFITVMPVPQDVDAGANLVVEFIEAHTPMSAASDTPWNASPETAPFHYILAYDVASRLLVRDPSQTNVAKVIPYKKIGDDGFANLIQVFKALEKEVPWRLKAIAKPVGLSQSGWRSS